MLHNSKRSKASEPDAHRLLGDLASLCLTAGEAIESIRKSDIDLKYKADQSPITQADLAAEKIINRFLQRYEIPIISEEASPEAVKPETLGDGAFWLVDPLDGTREFIAGRDHFTVNIALIKAGYPLLGAVYAPALAQLYLGLTACLSERHDERSRGCAWKFAVRDMSLSEVREALATTSAYRIQTRHACPGRWHALLSASHLDERTTRWVAEHPVTERSDFGSSLKFCHLAEGNADVYPRFAPTMAWDTAAGQAVLESAGGCVLDQDGKRLRYGSSNWRNGAFVAWGDAALASNRFIEHDAAGHSHVQTGHLTHHRQMHELIAGLADKSP
ncbi:MAG: 3'(2'),5'-bisphosphate nucleotidase CysQ [Betaproteobacteria bacterium]|nr:3'(2'),5'-bisphosphate nucleotidase CysQ [Betaproteobacteria bacterium]NCV39860.1 3'(2'),5'-bisphosphate nucleotidase CysQ [Betaproteobacteria bacterium]NCX22823.1 3'(2'),5'-bisphosphate nucleotidase CysQ [Betaproteobacteria bacterium]NCZ47134.1 3'(2'),5'-bisphosphate nucleotidase CysQ [Betaproteobacteria bacterium]NDA24030.1 3'(2'),5'-bisphosphate nucleotidase CysQ [Betaproteobacteria bacterium]